MITVREEDIISGEINATKIADDNKCPVQIIDKHGNLVGTVIPQGHKVWTDDQIEEATELMRNTTEVIKTTKEMVAQQNSILLSIKNRLGLKEDATLDQIIGVIDALSNNQWFSYSPWNEEDWIP